MLECEKALKDQLALYADKYEEFKANLADSNSSFEKFKSEMEKMNGKLINCERETRKWRGKCEESNKALIVATESKIAMEQKAIQAAKKEEQLRKLTRALQNERASLIKQLNVAKGIASGEGSPSEDNEEKDEENGNIQQAEVGFIVLMQNFKAFFTFTPLYV